MPTRIYVGNLDKDVPPEKEELTRKFKKYGDIVDVWVSRQPAGFAFVTYDTYKDALKAIEEMDGVKFQGKNLNIQLSMGKGGGLLNIFHLQLHKRNSLILEQVVVHSLPRVAQGQKLYLLRNLDERGAS
ncbi:SRSF3 [Symbiodinium pilosum]|uniref:SRSF3 protein n=1 Tax=Symbiodinium pilosum TaxID=2952 RepID=A0A812ITV0_SYMPI|nr:SRSF3 [Symbiodinium pilosum]